MFLHIPLIGEYPIRISFFTLFAALGEAGRELRYLLSRHCFAQAFACRGDFLWVVEMSDRIHYRASTLGGVAALEYPRAHENAVNSQLHAERRIGGSRNALKRRNSRRAIGRVRYREEERGRDAVFSGLGFDFLELLLFQKFLQLGNPRLTARICRTASTIFPLPCFAFCAYHRGTFIGKRHRFSQIARAADEGDGETVLSTWNSSSAGVRTLALIDEIHFQSLEHLRFGKMSDAALGPSREWSPLSVLPVSLQGPDIRATPPSLRMSGNTRSSAMTATAPAFRLLSPPPHS